MADQAKLDRPGIVAALRRKSLTMAELDRQHDYPKGTCRSGLFGQSYKGAKAIADALGMTVRELWPDCYLRQRGSEEDPTAPAPATASRKRDLTSDSARAA